MTSPLNDSNSFLEVMYVMPIFFCSKPTYHNFLPIKPSANFEKFITQMKMLQLCNENPNNKVMTLYFH